MTKEIEEGIKAIIFLQKYAGIDEPYEKAKRGWNSMSESEKQTTMRMYELLNGK